MQIFRSNYDAESIASTAANFYYKYIWEELEITNDSMDKLTS